MYAAGYARPAALLATHLRLRRANDSNAAAEIPADASIIPVRNHDRHACHPPVRSAAGCVISARLHATDLFYLFVASVSLVTSPVNMIAPAANLSVSTAL